jgi:glutamate racemase
MACPLLVPLVEEGLFDDAVTDAVLERYLAEIRAGDVDALVLGCTHYPLLSRAIARVAGPKISLVDSAANCARVVARHLDDAGLRAPAGKAGALDISFTDTPDGFLSVVRSALGLEAGTVRVRPVRSLGQ